MSWPRARLCLLLALVGCAAPEGPRVPVRPDLPDAAFARSVDKAAPRLAPCRADGTSACAAPPSDQRQRLSPGERVTVTIHPDDPIRGRQDAPVTVVVFSDFQCPHCKRFEHVLVELLERYPEHVRVVWKNFPLPMHAHARAAAELSRVAFRTGGNAEFWRLHDELFDNQWRLGPEELTRIERERKLSPPEASDRQRVERGLDEALA